MMKLHELTENVGITELVGAREVGVTGITTDSRKVGTGDLFACIRGGRADGHDFAAGAVRAGASVVLCERKLRLDRSVTQVVVKDARRALARIASQFFGSPSRHLTVIGVTGTNGKTTTVHLLHSIIEAWGKPVGMMGTLGHRIGDTVTKDPFTTPESPQVQAYMRAMVDRGQRFCVMEVSSHAIALGRVDDVEFDFVVFTNLTRDHLDFHQDLDDYRRTKMMLFGIGDDGRCFGRDRKAIINIGDETGRRIRDLSPLTCLTYCLDCKADVTGRISRLGWEGTNLEVTGPKGTAAVRTRLRGRSNAENVLAACAVSRMLEIPDQALNAGIERLPEVPGRMQVIDGPGRQAVVDYAHTPDALRRLLEDVRHMAGGRMICVFGCGGDRDQGKRPEMGKIAGELADFIIVTSDNPRTEDPDKIIQDIVGGIAKHVDYEVVPDRAGAIHRAVAVSDEGDVIVIAGKGHEDYQIVGTSRLDFDDRKAVREAFGAITNAKA
jgi:UDP-N-acetylmuramoyl-L-alanyl-D-glutamate--2,6-diaminopimelate ligase